MGRNSFEDNLLLMHCPLLTGSTLQFALDIFSYIRCSLNDPAHAMCILVPLIGSHFT